MCHKSNAVAAGGLAMGTQGSPQLTDTPPPPTLPPPPPSPHPTPRLCSNNISEVFLVRPWPTCLVGSQLRFFCMCFYITVSFWNRTGKTKYYYQQNILSYRAMLVLFCFGKVTIVVFHLLLSNSMNEWMNQSINQSINQSFHPSIHQYIHTSVHPSINQSINPASQPSTCPSTYPSIHQSLISKPTVKSQSAKLDCLFPVQE